MDKSNRYAPLVGDISSASCMVIWVPLNVPILCPAFMIVSQVSARPTGTTCLYSLHALYLDCCTTRCVGSSASIVSSHSDATNISDSHSILAFFILSVSETSIVVVF